jgi:hypothetical protein
MPDWYKNREEYYPAKAYIVSEGWGQTPEKAIENATINMARIFNVKVTVEENIIKRYSSMTDMKDFEEYFTEFSEETANLISDQNLVNIMFLEPSFDKKSRSYFTLAYIERSSTAKILMDRMKREQENMEYFVRMGASHSDPLIKYHYFTSAWLAAASNQMMQEQLDVLVPGIGTKPIYSIAELAAQKKKAAEKIRFKLIVSGDSNGRIEQALRTVVNNTGFSVSDQDAVLELKANTSIKKLDIDQDKLSFVSWEFQLNMDRGPDHTALSMMEEGKEGSVNDNNARLHAYESIQSFIENEFQQKLIAYFDTLNN